MVVKFLKEYKTADGRHYVVGQLAEIADYGAKNLIEMGVAEEHIAPDPHRPAKAETEETATDIEAEAKGEEGSKAGS